MKTSTALIGHEIVSVRAFGGLKKEKPLRYANSSCVFVKSGEEWVIGIDGYPIIVATANCKMILGHAEDVSVIDDIIREFWAHGVLAEKIMMCMQFASDESRESVFVEHAYQAGMRYVWAINSLADEHPSLARIRNERELVVVKRNA